MLAKNLPWVPVLVGVFMAFMAQMAGAHALSWAVGAYLPLSTTFPIFIGGMIKALADKLTKRKEESELSSGMLYATGLVAGGSLAGVGIAAVTAASDLDRVKSWLAAIGIEKPFLDFADLGAKFFPSLKKDGSIGAGVLGAVVFGVLCWLLYKNARKKLEA